MRRATAITLDDQERQTLQRWARGRSTPARLVLRAQIVLRAAEGLENLGIAEELGTGRLTVARWRNRFATGRLAGIEKDAPRGGRTPTIRSGVAPRIVEATTHFEDPDAIARATRGLGEAMRGQEIALLETRLQDRGW